MVKSDASALKTERLAQIAKRIAKDINKGINVKSLLDWIELTIGLTRGKALEYVKLVCSVHKWVFDEKEETINLDKPSEGEKADGGKRSTDDK